MQPARYEQQPQLQRDIVHDYRRGERGHEYIVIAQKHQLPVPTVQSVMARAQNVQVGTQSRRAVTKTGS